MPALQNPTRILMHFVLLVAACLLAGCAGLPSRPPVTPVAAIAASDSTALGKIAAEMSAGQSPDNSSVRPLFQASFALDARLELTRRAQSSLDVQTYQLGNDKTGR